MGSLTDHKNGALPGVGSLQDRELVFWAGGGNPSSKGTVPGATFVAFGDSYVDRSGTQTYNDGAARQWDSIVMWVELLMGNRLRPLNNAGVNGETTEQMLPRLQAGVLTYSPSICLLITPGLNDVKGAGTTLAGTQANLTSIFDQLSAFGIFCLTITVPPSNLIDTVAEKQFLFSLNRWLLDQANRRKGLIVVDAYSLVADPATVGWRAGYSTDLTHPTGVGAYAIAQAIVTELNKIIAGTGSLLSRSNADPYSLLLNPTMVGNTAGVADSTTVGFGGTGVASKIARTDGIPGEWQRWDQNVASTSTTWKTATTGFVAGNKVRAWWELRPDFTAAAPTSFYVYIEFRDAANAIISTNTMMSFIAAGDVPNPAGQRIVAETNAIVVPANTASIRSSLRLVGTGIIDIGNMSLRVDGT